MHQPRVIWIGNHVEHTFSGFKGSTSGESPSFRNAPDGAIEDLRKAGFHVDICETVHSVKELLSSAPVVGNYVAAIVSGGTDSAHLAFVLPFRGVVDEGGCRSGMDRQAVERANNIYLAVFDRDAAMSVEMRTMLVKKRGVDMVTCWSDHLVAGMKIRAAGGRANSAMATKVFEYRQQIHAIFMDHDTDKGGFIDGDEQHDFAQDVAKLMHPTPGEERNEALNHIWDTLVQIDKDGDGKISWAEFWSYVTGADTAKEASTAIVEQPKVYFTPFVLVVIQRSDGSFCLIHQQSKLWWLVGGELPFGASPESHAINLCKLQAGIDVRLEGVLRVEFDHRGGQPGSRMRTIYLARALNDYEPLKTVPDSHSIGAVWVDGQSVNQVDNDLIPLAGSEPAVWFEYVLKLGPVYPLEVFTSEGQPPHDHLMTAKAHAPFADSHCMVETGGDFRTTLGVIYPNSP